MTTSQRPERKPGRTRQVRCAAYACGYEWRSVAQNPECPTCGADAFDVDDGGWPAKCEDCGAVHTVHDECPPKRARQP
jgi:hypothetical protein